MKKKFVVLFLACIGFLPTIHALSKSEMQSVEYQKVFDFARLEGYTNAQGMIITDKYFVIAAVKNEETNTALYVFDKTTYQLVDLKENPLLKANYGHANDMAYSSKKHEIYIIHNQSMFVLDDTTFEIKETKTLPSSYAGMAYDEETDTFYFRDATKAYQANAKFQVTKSFAMPTNLTRQNIAYENHILYYTCYEYGAVSQYQTVYDGVLPAKSNVIYAYQEDGTLKNALYIQPGYGEIEAIEFDQGIPYLLFNGEDGKSAVYKPIVKNVKQTIEVGIAKELVEEDFMATLVGKDGVIETVASKDEKFVFSPISYTSPGTYHYTVTKSYPSTRAMPLADEEPQEDDEISLSVTVSYDTASDSLKSTVSYENDRDAFTAAFVSNDVDEPLEEGTVPNPETGLSIPVVGLLGILVLGFVFVFIGKKRFYKLH